MRTPKLSKAIIKCYWKPYAVLGVFTLIEVGLKTMYKMLGLAAKETCGDVSTSEIFNSVFSLRTHQEAIKVIQPIFLGKIIDYFENYNPDDQVALYETLGYTGGMSLCVIGLTLLHHLYFYHVQRSGMKIRVAMCHMVYKKVRRRTTI